MSELDDAAVAVGNLGEALDQNMEDLPRSEVVGLAVVNSDYLQSWEQQPGEPDGHFSSFLHYRDQGVGRQIRITVLHNKPDARPDDSFLYKVSRRYEWKIRAVAWDEDQERQYQLARSEAIREMVVRHEVDIEDAIEALMIPIKALGVAMESDEDFVSNLSKTDAKKLISLANQSARTIPSLMNAERLARDMPTEIVGGTIDHRHIVTVERDRIGEILEVLGRAGQLDDGSRNLGVGEIVDAEVVDVYPVSADGDDD